MSASPSPLLSMLISYSTSSPNSKKFGPPAGPSRGMKLAIKVTVLGLSGLTKAYRSVLSATGSLEMSGASRWDDISLPPLELGAFRSCLWQNSNQAHHKLRIAKNDFLSAGHHTDLARSEIAHMGYQGSTKLGSGCFFR